MHFDLKGAAVPVCLEPCKVMNKPIIGPNKTRREGSEEDNWARKRIDVSIQYLYGC